MVQDVQRYCTECVSCATRNTSHQLKPGLLQPIINTSAFETVAMDMLGPLPTTTNGNRYIIVFSDLFTKFTRAFAMPNAEAATVASIFVNNIVLIFGTPTNLLSDQGRNFTSNLFRETCQLLGINQLFTSAYHPQTDGQVERFNATLLNMISHYINTNQDNWDSILAATCFAYNTSIHRSTGETPFFLMFGRDARLPTDHREHEANQHLQSQTVPEFTQHLADTLTQAHHLAQQHLDQAHREHKAEYDRRHRAVTLDNNDKVWLYTPAVKAGRTTKLAHLWHGPFIIRQKIDDLNYMLTDLGGKPLKQPVHIQRLKRYHPTDNEEPMDLQATSAPINNIKSPQRTTPITEPARQDTAPILDRPGPINGDKYEIESLLDMRKSGRGFRVLVKWKGYPQEEATWEPSSRIPPQFIREFQNKGGSVEILDPATNKEPPRP
jgi:transposase InsO family protein